MRKRTIIAVAALAALASAPVPAPAAPAAPPPDAAAEPDPLRAAFEALPEAERRAVQDALVWTGDFNGAVAGSYGPRTRGALLAHAKRAGIAPGGAIDAPARAGLLAEAQAARRAVGFAMLRDPRAGVAIGLPLKLLPTRSTLPAGTRYAAADDGPVAETSGRAAGPEGLADVLARLTRDAPGRRVTYRLSKPDVVVVSGEAADRKFYSRYALGVAPGGGSVLRGFTLSYPKEAADLDRIALAVAASFDPFPAVEAPAPPAPTPPPRAVPPPAVLSGAAVLVGPGLALTRSDAARCEGAEAGGAPARWLRQDPATGLALLALPGHAEASPVALSSGDEPARLALFPVPAEDPAAAPVLSVAGVAGEAPGSVRAPLQGADAGAVLLDGAGALAGLTAGRGEAGMRIGGVVAETRYGVAGAGGIAAFLRDAAVPTVPAAGGALPPGEAAARWRPAILPLRCRAKPVASAAP